MKMKKIYCFHCGSELKRVETRVAYFDTETGKAIFSDILKCPNQKWYKPFSYHSKRELIDGYSCAYEIY